MYTITTSNFSVTNGESMTTFKWALSSIGKILTKSTIEVGNFI